MAISIDNTAGTVSDLNLTNKPSEQKNDFSTLLTSNETQDTTRLQPNDANINNIGGNGEDLPVTDIIVGAPDEDKQNLNNNIQISSGDTDIDEVNTNITDIIIGNPNENEQNLNNNIQITSGDEGIEEINTNITDIIIGGADDNEQNLNNDNDVVDVDVNITNINSDIANMQNINELNDTSFDNVSNNEEETESLSDILASLVREQNNSLVTAPLDENDSGLNLSIIEEDWNSYIIGSDNMNSPTQNTDPYIDWINPNNEEPSFIDDVNNFVEGYIDEYKNEMGFIKAFINTKKSKTIIDKDNLLIKVENGRKAVGELLPFADKVQGGTKKYKLLTGEITIDNPVKNKLFKKFKDKAEMFYEVRLEVSGTAFGSYDGAIDDLSNIFTETHLKDIEDEFVRLSELEDFETVKEQVESPEFWEKLTGGLHVRGRVGLRAGLKFTDDLTGLNDEDRKKAREDDIRVFLSSIRGLKVGLNAKDGVELLEERDGETASLKIGDRVYKIKLPAYKMFQDIFNGEEDNDDRKLKIDEFKSLFLDDIKIGDDISTTQFGPLAPNNQTQSNDLSSDNWENNWMQKIIQQPLGVDSPSMSDLLGLDNDIASKSWNNIWNNSSQNFDFLNLQNNAPISVFNPDPNNDISFNIPNLENNWINDIIQQPSFGLLNNGSDSGQNFDFLNLQNNAPISVFNPEPNNEISSVFDQDYIEPIFYDFNNPDNNIGYSEDDFFIGPPPPL